MCSARARHLLTDREVERAKVAARHLCKSAACLFLGGSGGGTFGYPVPCNWDDPSFISTSGSASPSSWPVAGRFEDDPLASSMKLVRSSLPLLDPVDPVACVLVGLATLGPGGECTGVEGAFRGRCPSGSSGSARVRGHIVNERRVSTVRGVGACIVSLVLFLVLGRHERELRDVDRRRHGYRVAVLHVPEELGEEAHYYRDGKL